MKQHAPKPLIEEHWHIQDLIRAQEKRTQEREYARDKIKLRHLRDETIAEAPVRVIKDFWCHSCHKDFIAMTIKEVEQDWSNLDQRIAFYRTKHQECGTWCMRNITNPLDDAFWYRSKAVARDRGKHSIDLLQPFENNYNLVWGKKK